MKKVWKKLTKGVYISNQKPYITTINKEIPIMMTFEQTGNTFTSTNSIKPVIINKNHANQYMLFTPEGRLLDNFTSAGPFVDFESAKRNAECNVGMAMNWSDF
jgi:hypothetical protein